METTGPTPTGPHPTGTAPLPHGAPRPVGHAGTRVDVTERDAWSVTGWPGVGALVLGSVAGLVGLALGATPDVGVAGTVAGVLLVVAGLLVVVVVGVSLTVVQPGETRVVQFFGRYAGTVRRTGLVMVAPFTTRRRMSVRVSNFETRRLKVNDANGNPVELAAVVVWQVADTARAMFAVESYTGFVQVQAESALRHVATTHPYDEVDGATTSLRGSTDLVALELAGEMAERVAVAGVEIIEVRISHLAYAPEIAQAMLQRQQASAIVAARARIVDGAVGMVELALERLRERDVVDLDEERKAAMVSNLLVVLCGDSRATPVVNTGTLYQ